MKLPNKVDSKKKSIYHKTQENKHSLTAIPATQPFKLIIYIYKLGHKR